MIGCTCNTTLKQSYSGFVVWKNILLSVSLSLSLSLSCFSSLDSLVFTILDDGDM